MGALLSPRALDPELIDAVLSRSPLPTVCLDLAGHITGFNAAARPLLSRLGALLPALAKAPHHLAAGQTVRFGGARLELRLQPLREVGGKPVGHLLVALSSEAKLPTLALEGVAGILADTWATLDALATVARCLNR